MTQLRMLYTSNAFWCNSGYGVQGRSLLPRLANLPHFGYNRSNIDVFAWFGMQGGVQTIDGFRCFPGIADPYGNDVIGSHVKFTGANVVVSLIDVWVMKHTAQAVAPALWLPWFPIDMEPIPQAVLDSLQGAYLPLTYSKWGHDLLTKTGVENHYIPHGIEPSVFRVIPDREHVLAQKRQMTGLDNAHLTIGVWANKGFPSRKNFDGQLAAWAEFAKDKPHARFYLHTEPTPMYGGLDIPALTQELGIADKVIFPDRYLNAVGLLPGDYLAFMYNMADVYMGATLTEGFGIPIIEAQGCGLPAIVTDYSSMPELVRWGTAVETIDGPGLYMPIRSWYRWPSHRGMVNALEEYHQVWLDNGHDLPMARRLETQNAIHAEYNWDAIVRDQWTPLLDRIAKAAPPLDARFAPQEQGVTFYEGARV